MGAAVGSGGKKRGGITGINVTPMVDIMLVLLVIMMVSATHIVKASIKVELPKSHSTDEQVPIVSQIMVMKDGKYQFNSKPVTEAELTRELGAVHAKDPDASVVLSADTQAEHRFVVRAMDISKSQGIVKFAISIAPE